MEDRRFIEETFPVREVSLESAKEKSIRRGHISTLHIWWARRPLSSSRATSFASLIPVPKNNEESEKKKNFIVKLSKWQNSLDMSILGRATQEILDMNGGKRPKVLDPFAGGGAIPLEALRLGCETYASDYNPVATLILKCVLEYPEKHGGRIRAKHGLVSCIEKNPLLEDVKKWGGRVLDQAENEIGKFFPAEKDGSIPGAYIWAKTIPCQNPSCNAEIPLMRQYWLANRDGKKISLYPHVAGKIVKFSIVGDGYDKIPGNFNPDNGSVSKAVAKCLVCGSVVDDKTTRSLFTRGKSSERMVAVISHKEKSVGKRYRVSTNDDLTLFEQSRKYLENKRSLLMERWGIDPIPDEPIHTPDGKEYQSGGLLYNFTPVLLYGMTRWGSLFNSRQKLTAITFVEKVRIVYEQMLLDGMDQEYARAVVSYIALTLDRLVASDNILCRWQPAGEKIAGLFSRQALPMVWDYAETNPFGHGSRNWRELFSDTENVLYHCCRIANNSASVSQMSATTLPYAENFFDAILTDPPYYDNVPYAVLSDFFYVWLKRSIGELYPDLFSTPLTPKSDEAIADLPLLRGMSKDEAARVIKGIKTGQHFENMLLQSFKEMRRVLKPNGICVIVYAHKSTAGWETLINSLLDSGLVVTGAWPIHTEMRARLRSQESAALASSIYMIARNFGREDIGFYRDVRDRLKKHLEIKLDQLWREAISGADFFIAAIGSSVEVFGKYERIIDDEGHTIRANVLLEDVRRVVTNYAVRQVLHNGFAAEITPLTRFYVLWRWGYGNVRLEFDDALKLARGVGIDITQEWNKGFIKKDKQFVSILGPEDRDLEELRGSRELIDVLHNVVLLWNKGKNDEAVEILKETGYGKSDIFYRVAQAISESLPNGREKKLLEVFLSGKERITEQVRKDSVQTRLLE
jgi:putative DNA methylase